MMALTSRGAKWALSLRVFSAAVGGYLLSMLLCINALQWLDLSARDGRLLVNTAFFVVYLLIVLWAFAVARTRTVVLGIFLPVVALAALRWTVNGALL